MLAVTALLAVIAVSGGVVLHWVVGARAGTEPPSAVPSVGQTIAPGTSGLDAIPASMDGQPILRGAQISARIATVQDTTPFLVAGWVTFANVDCWIAPDQLGDCGSGYYLNAAWPTGQPWFYLGRELTGDQQAWIGGGPLFVARVHAHDAKLCGSDWMAAWCRDALTVEAWIDPPAQFRPTPAPSPSPTPEPRITANPLAAQIPTSIRGEPVYYGSAIDAHLKSGAKDPFLVVGTVMEVMLDTDCQPIEVCPTKQRPYDLIEPGAIHWKISYSNYPLLTSEGFWQPGSTLHWPGNLVVLRVEPSNRGCPLGFTFYCSYGISDPLIVDAVVPPTSGT